MKKKKYRELKPVLPSKAVETNYRVQLKKLLRTLNRSLGDSPTQESVDRLSAMLDSPVMTNAFRKIAEGFVTDAGSVHKKAFIKSIAIDVFSSEPWLFDYAKAVIDTNTLLIKSMASDYIKNVSADISEIVRTGVRSSTVAKSMSNSYGISVRKAELIARDQTAKVNGELNKLRQQEVGIDLFKWRTSEDQRVRDWHTKIANTVTKYGKGIYSWNDLPKDQKGNRIMPGQDYNCRCVGIPVVPDD